MVMVVVVMVWVIMMVTRLCSKLHREVFTHEKVARSTPTDL